MDTQAQEKGDVTTATDTTAKRHRATKEEMASREESVLRAIGSEDEPVTIKFVMEHTGLSHIRASTLVRRLIDEGKIDVVGKNGRELLLRPGSGQPKVNASTVTVRELPSVDAEDVLRQLHIGLGNELRVAGLHLVEGAKPIIDLRTPDGATLRVTTVNNAA